MTKRWKGLRPRSGKKKATESSPASAANAAPATEEPSQAPISMTQASHQIIEYVHRDREAATVVVPDYPRQWQFLTYWSTLCDNVSSASSRPMEVWRLFRKILLPETTLESLEGHDGFETLWAKRRTAMIASLKGQLLDQILLFLTTE